MRQHVERYISLQSDPKLAPHAELLPRLDQAPSAEGPPEPPASANAAEAGERPPAGESGATEEALARLRNCESGGDYTAVSYRGWYRGAYQFDQATWDSVASRTMPDLIALDPAQASPPDQDSMARALYVERLWSPWPTCGVGL